MHPYFDRRYDTKPSILWPDFGAHHVHSVPEYDTVLSCVAALSPEISVAPFLLEVRRRKLWCCCRAMWKMTGCCKVMRRCVQNKGLYRRLLAPPRRGKLFFQFGETILMFGWGSELERESRIQKESGLIAELYAEIKCISRGIFTLLMPGWGAAWRNPPLKTLSWSESIT